MISLYLAEDQAMLNTALTQLLELEDDLTVVGTATNGNQAWADIQRLQPNVAILDIEMPGKTGLALAEKIHQANLPIRVVILTTFAQKAYFEQAVRAQVAAYLLKDSPSDDLIAIIRRVQAGAVSYAPELVRNMLSAETNPLTAREMAVLQKAAAGAPNKQIAAELFLSEGTVRNYLSAIFSKLAVHNRLEAVNVARENKWLVD